MSPKQYFKNFIYIQILVFVISIFFLNKDFWLLGAFSGKFAIYVFWIIAIPGILQRFRVKKTLQKVQLFLMKNRRYLGIIMFNFAFIHYMWLKGFNIIKYGLPEFIPNYQIFGMLALTLSLPLVITSNNFSVKKLGKFWKTLHYLVYPIMFLLVLHTSLQGRDYALIYGLPSAFILILQIYSQFYSFSNKSITTKTDAYFKLKVSKVENNTGNAINIHFNIPTSLNKFFIFQAGQHISLKISLNNKIYYRSYSIYNQAEQNNSIISICVKRKINGLVSNYINDNVKGGMEIMISKPFGDFFNTSQIKPETKNIYLIAGGSGITPILNIITFLLKSKVEPDIHLIYANSNIASILFKGNFDKLLEDYKSKFKIHHIISDENTQNPEINNKFQYIFKKLNPQLLESLIHLENSIFYLCGPNPLMEMCQKYLLENNVDSSHIHLEFFGINQNNKILYNQGALVPEDGKYTCIDCGYTQFFKKGDVFPVCPICAAGQDDSEYDFWKKC